MQTIQGNRLVSIRAARAFLAAHEAHLPPEVIALCARLDATISSADEHIAVQEAATIEMQMASRQYHALRNTLLRSHIGPLVNIAQLEVGSTAALAAIKRPSGNPSAERLAASAEGLLVAVKPYNAALVAGGLRPDFGPRLDAASHAMLGAFQQTKFVGGRRRGATTGLRIELARARKLIDAIASMLHDVFIEHPALADNWVSVKRVHAPARRPALSAGHQAPALANREVKRLYSGGDEDLDEVRQAS